MATMQVPDQFVASFDALLAEFKRQDSKFGEQDHTAHEWNNIIGEEFGEAVDEFTQLTLDFAAVARGIGQISRQINEQAYLSSDKMTTTLYIAELLQTAACCIRAAVNAQTRFLDPVGSTPANQLVAGKYYFAEMVCALGTYSNTRPGSMYLVKYMHAGGAVFRDDEGNEHLGFASDFTNFTPLES